MVKRLGRWSPTAYTLVPQEDWGNLLRTAYGDWPGWRLRVDTINGSFRLWLNRMNQGDEVDHLSEVPFGPDAEDRLIHAIKDLAESEDQRVQAATIHN